MVYFVWGLLAILAIIYRKNAIVTTLVFLFITIVFCGNTSSPDLEIYKLHYYGTISQSVISEPLFVLFESAFKNSGFSYEVFRGVFAILGLSLITLVFCKYSPYPALALLMYSIYPMTIDVVQLRFTIGYSIVFFGISYLLDYHRTHHIRDCILFGLAILIGSGFHYACMFYAVLIVLVLDTDRHNLLFLLLIPLSLITVLKSIGQFVSFGSSIVGDHKADVWIAYERDIPMRAIVRIYVTRSIPFFYCILLSHIKSSSNYDNYVGKEVNCLGLFDPNRNSDDKTFLGTGQYYDIRINRYLFYCIFYILIFSILEADIRGDYERLSRVGLLASVILTTRQISYLEYSNRVISAFLYLVIYVAYFAGIMFFMKSGVFYFVF